MTTNSHKLPAGYKQTDVGVIPEEWDVKKLSDCCRKITDGTHDTPKPIDNGIPFLTAIHVKESFIDFDNCYFLPQNIHETIYRRCNPEKNDVLMVNIGSGVATTALVDVDYEFSLKNVALLKPDDSSLIGSYLNYYQTLSKPRITSSISSGGAQPFLSLRQISGLLIALPTKAEQTAITTVLSDTDALIGKLELLIEKKRNIKQGAMQELLTGKRRLPGFSGKWETKQLGDLCDIGKGIQKGRSKLADSGKYPVWNGGIEPSGYSEDWNTDANTITISEGGNSCGFVNYCMQKLWLGGHCYAIQNIRSNIEKIFLYQVLKYKEVVIMSLRVGSGLPNIQKNNLSNMDFIVPDNKAEQTAIANVLSEVDEEIEKLESRLAKYQNIKQGMMQTLLTGKIRLI